MTEHERLLEEFDDAYFALLMEGVANKEGERLEALNEMLQDNPEAALPESVDKRCLEAIDRHFAREQRRAGLRKTGKILRLAAIIMGISALLFTTAFAFSEHFRVATLNLMLTVTERYTQFNIKNPDESSRQTSPGHGTADAEYFQNAEIGWIPEGFECTESIPDNRVTFENEEGEFFFIHIISGTANVNVDTENPESIEHISINGSKGLCIVKYGQVEIFLADLENNLYIEVGTSSGLSVETAKKIAENITIKGSDGSNRGLSSGSNVINAEYFQNAKIGWIPEGFSYSDGKYDKYARFENESGDFFDVSIHPGSGTIVMDTENTDSLEKIFINGNEGICTIKMGEIEIITADLTNQVYIELSGSEEISIDTAKKIVENIYFIG